MGGGGGGGCHGGLEDLTYSFTVRLVNQTTVGSAVGVKHRTREIIHAGLSSRVNE